VLSKEELEEIRARSEYTPQMSLRHPASWNHQHPMQQSGEFQPTYVVQSVRMYRDIIFSISYSKEKLVLLFLCNDTWLVLEKSHSTWQWVTQFLLGARIWVLPVTMPVEALCICISSTWLFSLGRIGIIRLFYNITFLCTVLNTNLSIKYYYTNPDSICNIATTVYQRDYTTLI
jgi:hypothetical protein